MFELMTAHLSSMHADNETSTPQYIIVSVTERQRKIIVLIQHYLESSLSEETQTLCTDY